MLFVDFDTSVENRVSYPLPPSKKKVCAYLWVSLHVHVEWQLTWICIYRDCIFVGFNKSAQ